MFCFPQWDTLLMKYFVTAASVSIKHQLCVKFHDFSYIPIDISQAFDCVSFQFHSFYFTGIIFFRNI